jgi:transposase
MDSGEQPLASSESRHDHRHAQLTSHEKIDAVLRLLKGESIEPVSHELGVSVDRMERWKSRFVAAGSAELARRTDDSSKSWAAKHSVTFRQWIWLLFALVATIIILAVLVQHGGQE